MKKKPCNDFFLEFAEFVSAITLVQSIECNLIGRWALIDEYIETVQSNILFTFEVVLTDGSSDFLGSLQCFQDSCETLSLAFPVEIYNQVPWSILVPFSNLRKALRKFAKLQKVLWNMFLLLSPSLFL